MKPTKPNTEDLEMETFDLDLYELTEGPRINANAMIKYCKENNIEPDELTAEEAKKFFY